MIESENSAILLNPPEPEHPATFQSLDGDLAVGSEATQRGPVLKPSAAGQIVVTYLRTAADPAGEQLELQRARLSAWAHAYGLTVVREFIDVGISAHTAVGKRQGFRTLLSYCRKHRVSAIITLDPSRVARDPKVYSRWLHRLARRGLWLEFASGPQRPADVPRELWAGVLQTVSDFYVCGSRRRGRRPRATLASSAPAEITPLPGMTE